MRYCNRSGNVEATRWFKNGDHPFDYALDKPGIAGGDIATFTGAEQREHGWEGQIVRYYRHPILSGEYFCPVCQQKMHEHGWLDFPPGGQPVCPGDWIVRTPGGGHRAIPDKVFVELFVEREP